METGGHGGMDEGRRFNRAQIMNVDLEPYRNALPMPEILSGLGITVNGSGDDPLSCP